MQFPNAYNKSTLSVTLISSKNQLKSVSFGYPNPSYI